MGENLKKMFSFNLRKCLEHLRHYQTQSCVFNPSKIKAFRSKRQSAAVSRCYLMCYLDKRENSVRI